MNVWNTRRGSDRPEHSARRHARHGRPRLRRLPAVMAAALVAGGASAALLGLPMSAGATGTGPAATTESTTSSTTSTSGSTTNTTTSTTATTSKTTTTTSTTSSSGPGPGFTVCQGHVTPEPQATPGEPNTLGYSFSCNGAVSSFTVTLDRSGEKNGTIDDFNPSSTVLAGSTAVTTEGFNCGGETPSNGFNCNPLSSTKPSPMTGGDTATGSFDPIEPYCKFLPAKAKPGTLATPGAVVSIVVTDTTGYEEGPFVLTDTKKCPSVPNVAPPKKTKGKGKAKQHPHHS